MTVLGALLVVIGAGWTLLSAVGTVRLRDVYARLHATAKATSLGVTCLLTGVALLSPDIGSGVKMLVAIAFHLAAAPVAAHVIGRAAYRAGAPLSRRTAVDELGGRERGPGDSR